MKLVLDRDSGRPRGFAFFALSTDAETAAAIDGLHGKDFGGRRSP